jgi:hypothetical protein
MDSTRLTIYTHKIFLFQSKTFTNTFFYYRVLVLDKGEIKEFDTPQNLLNDSNSIFAGMAKDAGL